MKFKVRTGLNKDLLIKFLNKTKKKLRIEALFKLAGDKWSSKEFVYIQIYDEDGHLLYNKKLRFFGDKLIESP